MILAPDYLVDMMVNTAFFMGIVFVNAIGTAMVYAFIFYVCPCAMKEYRLMQRWWRAIRFTILIDHIKRYKYFIP